MIVRWKSQPGFSALELVLAMFAISIFSGIVFQTVVKSYSNNRKVEAQSIVQTELNLANDRLTRVLRSATALVEATQTNLKIRGYANTADSAPSEINFYLDGAAIRYSVIAPTGTAPNYVYPPGNAEIFTLIGKSTNSTGNPVFRYYDENGILLTFPVNLSAVNVIEPNLSALDGQNVLTQPIIVTTKITLRNFKTNL